MASSRAHLHHRANDLRFFASGLIFTQSSARRESLYVMEIWPGKPYPLGATFDGTGTNFAIFSSVADKIELCLIDDSGGESRVELREVDAHVWHCYLPGIRPGQRYGFRVHGPFEPENGHRCDPSKILLDPYSKAIEGQVDNHQANCS